MDHLKEDLENYMAQYPKVKILRSKERVGLIGARMMGVRKATAPGIDGGLIFSIMLNNSSPYFP